MSETVITASMEAELLADERAAACHTADLRAGLRQIVELVPASPRLDREEAHQARLRATLARVQVVGEPRRALVPLTEDPLAGEQFEINNNKTEINNEVETAPGQQVCNLVGGDGLHDYAHLVLVR